MAFVSNVEHVSKHVLKVSFSGYVRNDSFLRSATGNHFINHSGGSLYTTKVYVATWQESQVYTAPPYLGGLISFVWLYFVEDIDTLSGSLTYNFGQLNEYYTGAAVTGVPFAFTTKDYVNPLFVKGDGLVYKETLNEFSKQGGLKYKEDNPMYYSLSIAIGKIFDVITGGFIDTLNNTIVGEFTTSEEIETYFSGSGFSIQGSTLPGLGDTIQTKSGKIIPHIERLYGASDGSNQLFRTTLAFNPFSTKVIVVKGSSNAEDGFISETKWFAPNDGDDRIVRIPDTLPYGSSVLAVYAPQKTLLRIDKEIIATDNIDIYNGTYEISGRDQLCTLINEHKAGTTIEDFWCLSLIRRTETNLFAFGASGKALETLAKDLGPSKDENVTMTDTELRRSIFNTAVTMRGSFINVYTAIRYIYSDLWPYIRVMEDVRWPGCVVIWYSTTPHWLGDFPTQPAVEPWEAWLDHASYPDGFIFDAYYETYYRNPTTDTSYVGDFFLSSFASEPTVWPYPVILSGPIISVIGPVAPILPQPSSVSDEYKLYLSRPEGLNRVLPTGTGVLILDASLAGV